MAVFDLDAIGVAPLVEWQERHAHKVRKVPFGDGFEEVAPDGLTNKKTEVSLEFIVNESQRQALESGLDATQGSDKIQWTKPDETTQYLWRKEGAYTTKRYNDRLSNIQFTLYRFSD